MIKEWGKREILTPSTDSPNLSSIVRCIAGQKENQHCVKVFFKEKNNQVQDFIKKQGKTLSLSDETKYEFVNVYEDLEKMQKEAIYIKQKENEAPDIDRDRRSELENYIYSTAEKIYTKYSNVVGIDVSNFHSKSQKETSCIVLYCLDKVLIPFGEKKLPSSLLFISKNEPFTKKKVLCDVREEIIMFGSCDNCLANTFNLGCSIGGPLNGGSVGFLINSPFKGFLTAAHVAAEDANAIYKCAETGFERTKGRKEDIAHPFNSSFKIGTVEHCFFGNFDNNGLDVAIVRMASSMECLAGK